MNPEYADICDLELDFLFEDLRFSFAFLLEAALSGGPEASYTCIRNTSMGELPAVVMYASTPPGVTSSDLTYLTPFSCRPSFTLTRSYQSCPWLSCPSLSWRVAGTRG